MTLEIVARSSIEKKYIDPVIVPATADHVRQLKDTMREKDKKEIESFGIPPKRGLWNSYKQGLMNKTMLVDGNVAAIWGCGGTYLGEIGHPWLLTSCELDKVLPVKIFRMYRAQAVDMLQVFHRLENYVEASYHKSIRLLSLSGFTIGEPEPFGKGMFRKFSMTRES